MIRYIVLFSMILQPCFAYETHQNVYFDFDESENYVESIKLKNFNKDDVFLIQGYADPTGDEDYNRFLSRERAEFVRGRILSEYGLRKDQVKITFYGEDYSKDRSNSEKRRVEIKSGTQLEISKLMKGSGSLAVAKRNRENYNQNNISADNSYEGVASSDLNNTYGVSDESAGLEEENITEEKGPLKSSFVEQRVVTSSDSDEEEGSASNSFKDQSASNENYVERRESKTKYQDRYYVGAGVYNNILLAGDRGTGNSAKWVSGENYNIEAQYQFKYKNFWFGVNGSYHIQDYEVELNPIFTWNEKTPSLLRLSLVSDYETKRWGLGFDLDYHQTSFVYEENFNVELRDIFMLGVSLRAKYKWLETGKWSSRLGLKLDLPLTGSDEISPKGELGYIGFIDLKRDRFFRDYGLNVKLYYGFRNYTNDQNDQEEEVAGVLFSVTSFNWL